jgi:hypothetical protein
MISFKNYLIEATANTILSDINEIYVGYVLFGNRWFDNDAKKHYNTRIKEASKQEILDAQGKSTVMAEKFLIWAKKHGYSGRVTNVWWTARPGSMSKAVGVEVDQRKNPTDVLIQFSSGPANGFLGLSAKSTKTSGEIGFKNPGVGTVDRNLGLSLSDVYKNLLIDTIKKLKLPEGANERKGYIRSNPKIKAKTEKLGVEMLSDMRDLLLTKIKKLNQKQLKDYLLSDWMDAELLYPPYVKVTGQGNKPPYNAVVLDPLKNEKLDALSKYKITLEPVGNESIGVMAGDKKIMKIRFKFESEKMASSLKLSGDPW